tara:strand:+ start:169 stop:948 length:780 start_codon:yes stop_codon:yes gene_type:complete
MLRKIKSILLFLLFKIPLNLKFVKSIELLIFNHQGKAWGSETIKDEVNACLYLLNKKPTVFIDIGVNKGLYTEYILKKFPDLESHLFEPSNLNYKILSDKFSLNKNIILNNIGLSNSNSKGILYSDTYGSGLASVTKRRLDHLNINLDQKEEINLIRFDEYWEKDQLIDYVKIDVEGHELDVLNGFGELIYKTKLIQFEFGGCNIDTRTFFQDFWYFFLEKNFNIYRITPRGVLKINQYEENMECFITTNFIAINNNLL